MDIPLTQDTGGALAECDDPVAALLVLHLNAVWLVAAPRTTAWWETKMTLDGLWDEYWILSNEANVQRWPRSSARKIVSPRIPASGASSARGGRFFDQALARPQNRSIPVPPLAAPPTADQVSEP